MAIGLENLIIVETTDAVLVADKKSSEMIKKIVSLMNERGLTESQNHKLVAN